MTNDDSTHQRVRISQNEIEQLADRMFNRAISKLYDMLPENRKDTLLAVAILRQTIHTTPIDGLEIHVWQTDNHRN
jgi:hypothetical protein